MLAPGAPVESGPLEKLDPGAQDLQVLGPEIRPDRNLHLALADLGLDELLPLLACHRDPVVSVDHEIDVAHLEQDHGGRPTSS